MITRRTFLKALATFGTVAAIPTALLPDWKLHEPTIGTWAALERSTVPFWERASIGATSSRALTFEMLQQAMDAVELKG
jgi:hypothetical protein